MCNCLPLPYANHRDVTSSFLERVILIACRWPSSSSGTEKTLQGNLHGDFGCLASVQLFQHFLRPADSQTFSQNTDLLNIDVPFKVTAELTKNGLKFLHGTSDKKNARLSPAFPSLTLKKKLENRTSPQCWYSTSGLGQVRICLPMLNYSGFLHRTEATNCPDMQSLCCNERKQTLSHLLGLPESQSKIMRGKKQDNIQIFDTSSNPGWGKKRKEPQGGRTA